MNFQKEFFLNTSFIRNFNKLKFYFVYFDNY